jgi:hypothetical protein
MRRIAVALRPLGLDPEDPVVQNAVLGREVTEWMEGPIGSFVMDRVRKRLELLEQSLKRTDPFKDPNGISKAQAEILHWEIFAGWLGDAIQSGINAEKIIEFEVGESDGQDG